MQSPASQVLKYLQSKSLVLDVDLMSELMSSLICFAIGFVYVLSCFVMVCNMMSQRMKLFQVFCNDHIEYVLVYTIKFMDR